MGKQELAVNSDTALTNTKFENFQSLEEMKKWAITIIDSGLLPDSISEPEQVITIVQHGKELGLTPHIAMNNIHVIAGRPVISSSMLGAMLKKHGVEWTIEEDFKGFKDENSVEGRRTSYKFFWKSKVTGTVLDTTFSITWAQMELAGYTSKQNWAKYPKEMMRARCLTYGVRALFPEVFLGLYSDIEINDIAQDLGAEEMAVTVTESGEIEIQH